MVFGSCCDAGPTQLAPFLAELSEKHTGVKFIKVDTSLPAFAEVPTPRRCCTRSGPACCVALPRDCPCRLACIPHLLLPRCALLQHAKSAKVDVIPQVHFFKGGKSAGESVIGYKKPEIVKAIKSIA